MGLLKKKKKAANADEFIKSENAINDPEKGVKVSHKDDEFVEIDGNTDLTDNKIIWFPSEKKKVWRQEAIALR